MSTDPVLTLKAKTIDEVIESLDKIIEWSKKNKKRTGYFAALYRKVTVQVKKGIRDGIFEDGERMERLDVIFANRYLVAFEQYQNSKQLSLSWKFTFDATHRWRAIVLQHLLIGMNTHIDLDLGIAAAKTVDAQNLPDLKEDFYKINNILTSLINEVQTELGKIWPLLRLLDYVAGEADEFLAKLGMKIARGHAWKVTEELSKLSPDQQILKIDELDQNVAEIGKKILKPTFIIQYILFLIRISEVRSVRRIIKILE